MKQLLPALFLLISLSAAAQSKEQLIGCWKMPSRKGESLQLNKDGSFAFNDYSSMKKALENYYGTWKSTGIKVTLMYDDRPQQNFTIRKDKNGKTILRKEGGFMLVKGTAADCNGK